MILPLILLLPPCQAAETPPPGGVVILREDAALTPVTGEFATSTKVQVSDQNFSQAVRVDVKKAVLGKPWCVQLGATLADAAISTGDLLLLSYMARCAEGDEGLVTAKLQLPAPEYSSAGVTDSAKFGTGWERIYQTISVNTDVPAGKGRLQFFLGGKNQSIEIADVSLVNYGRGFDMAKLPRRKVTYEGRGPDAAWRAPADARIEKIRKADYALQLVGANGKPLANKAVTVDLARHEFGFGSCVTRQLLTADSPDGLKYREIVKRSFSKVVFENDFKPAHFPNTPAGLDELDQSLAWLAEHGISARGHYLIQEAVDAATRPQLADPLKFKKDMFESVRARIAFAGNRVVDWDVINHPIAWEGAELLGRKGPPLASLSMDVLHEAARLTELPLCINEDQIFKPGAQQDDTYELLARLKKENVKIGGLGNQGHFNSGFLPPPEELLRITDRFTAVVPKQFISEYDITTNADEELAADYTRDVMTVCFSHPAYDAFIIWGFWEGRHWVPSAAFWKSDWRPTPAALVWENLILRQWHTRETLTSDASGIIRWRGFKGFYQLITGDGKSSAALRPGSPQVPGKFVLP
jgi:endo-1,4-beta-xylanase